MSYEHPILKFIHGKWIEIIKCPHCELWVRYHLFNKEKEKCYFCIKKEGGEK